MARCSNAFDERARTLRSEECTQDIGVRRDMGGGPRQTTPPSGKVVAVLSLATAAESFSEKDITAARQIAAAVGSALHATMRAQLAHLMLADMRGTLAATAQMHQSQDLQGCSRAVLLAMPSLVEGAQVRIVLRMERGSMREMCLRNGEFHDLTIGEQEWGAREVVLRRAMEHGTLVNVARQHQLIELGYVRLGMMMHAIEVGRTPMPPPEAGGLDAPLEGPVLACPLLTGVDAGCVIGVVELRRSFAQQVFTAADEIKVLAAAHKARYDELVMRGV